MPSGDVPVGRGIAQRILRLSISFLRHIVFPAAQLIAFHIGRISRLISLGSPPLKPKMPERQAVTAHSSPTSKALIPTDPTRLETSKRLQPPGSEFGLSLTEYMELVLSKYIWSRMTNPPMQGCAFSVLVSMIPPSPEASTASGLFM